MQVAIVIPSEFEAGRWLLCRRNSVGWTTVVSDHCTQSSAEQERRKLQAAFDAAGKPVDPDAPRQLVLGFYGPGQE